MLKLLSRKDDSNIYLNSFKLELHDWNKRFLNSLNIDIIMKLNIKWISVCMSILLQDVKIMHDLRSIKVGSQYNLQLPSQFAGWHNTLSIKYYNTIYNFLTIWQMLHYPQISNGGETLKYLVERREEVGSVDVTGGN